MVRRKEQLFFAIMLAADVAALSASFMLAYWLRSHFLRSTYGPIAAFADYAWAIWVVLPSFVVVLAGFGLYRSTIMYRSPGAVVRSTVVSVLFGTLTVLGALYMMKQTDLSRLVLDIFTLVCAMVLPAEKLALNAVLEHVGEYRRKRGKWQVLILGESDEAQAYLRLLETHAHWGVMVAGIVNPTQRVTLAAVSAAGGGAERAAEAAVDWRELLKDYVVDEVVAVSPWSEIVRFTDLQEACAERGLIFRVLVTMPPPRIGRYYVEDVGGGSYLVSLETVPQDFLPLMLKRALDIAGSLVGLILCGLVYVCYAPLLWWESPGPVFFKQKRGGHNGRIFTAYKFRTMCVDAEERLPHLAPRNGVTGVMFKMQNDPRVVPCGRIMRRTHLDELPQFWNVLKGEMSLVGPRPNPAREVMGYDYHHQRRLSMKPGITGVFQVNGHAAISDFEEVVKLDCEYIDNWSLWLDCKIILKTLLKVVRADGW